MESLLENKQHLQNYLYVRGFLITDDCNIDISIYPFYGLWKEIIVGGYRFYIHNKQRLFTRNMENGDTAFMIGHAYNPICGMSDEYEILDYIYQQSDIYSRINELTGIFVMGIVSENKITFIGDATCMQSVFYGKVDSNVYISSHSYLLKDILKINNDPFIDKLIAYKYYRLFGRMLPGDRTSYSEFRRIEPNYEYIYEKHIFTKKRFYPVDKLQIANCESEYNRIINQSYQIMKKSMTLIPQKWDRPAISLSGGCDSKTTLSCVDDYAKYKYFSFISTAKEEPDAKAAHQIANLLGINHKIYTISSNNSDFEDIETIEKVLEQNCGNIGINNQNDIRKRAFFMKCDDFDVEVKSWVSEIARAYYHKRFNKNRLPKKLTPRIMTTMYKVIVNNKTLAKGVDNIFDEYLSEYYGDSSFDKMNWYDLVFWEYRVAAWNGLVISGEQNLSHDITIPYNNRILLNLLLKTPLKKRIHDLPHKDIQRLGNKMIADTSIAVQNVEHTKLRAIIEGIYFDVYSKIII